MALIKIKSWRDGNVLFSGEYISLKEAVEAAVKARCDLRCSNLSGSNLRYSDLRYSNLSDSNLCGSDLRCSNLSGSDLSGSDLSGSNLSGSDLRCSNLSGSNLRYSNLRYSNLRYSNLSGSNLSEIKCAFQAHDLLAEILRRAAAGDIEKLKIAGYILVCRQQCWNQFLKLAARDPLGDWALDELAKWVQDGDSAPKELRERAKKLAESRTD